MWKRLVVFWPFIFFSAWIFFDKPVGGKVWIAFGMCVIMTIGMTVLMGIGEGNSSKNDYPENNSG